MKVRCPQCNGDIFEVEIDRDTIARGSKKAVSRDMIVYCPKNHPNKIHLKLDD